MTRGLAAAGVAAGVAARRAAGTARRRLLLIGIAFVVALAAAVSSGWRIAAVLDQTSYTQTYSVRVAGLDRSYEVIAPTGKLAGSAPVIVVLHGIAVPLAAEIKRDHLVPYVDAGQAELVYPAGYLKSWNAGGCCGKAAASNVNDVAFLTALAARVDRGHRRPLYLVGYSNGGRMAYRMACDSPGVFDAMAIVKAMPEPYCTVSRPQTILQIDSVDDTFVPYRPGDKGTESPPATVQSARLRALDRCSGPGTSVGRGAVTLTTWTCCATGTRYAFAVYQKGGHSFPQPSGPTLSGAQVIWSFFTGTPVAG